MKTHLLLLIGLQFIGLCACTSTSTQTRDDSYYQLDRPRGDQSGDLFSSQGDMSDAEIAKILDYRLQLPTTSRLAILHLSANSYWRFYSNDFSKLNDAIAANFIGTLQASNRIYDAAYLPALLVPEQRTLPYLRAAAARYQADLLLLYRDQCGSFEKYRVFAADETRAYCAVEAVMLDIRTGIIPFTGVATETFTAHKQKGDKNFYETIKQAEFQALAKALERLATDLNRFLEWAS